MQFPTLIFALFFVATLTVSWLLQRWRTWQKLFLLLASYWFYAGWKLAGAGDPRRLVAAQLWRGRADRARPSRSASRAWMWAGVCVNLLALGVFKYYNFFHRGAGRCLGIRPGARSCRCWKSCCRSAFRSTPSRPCPTSSTLQRKPEVRAKSLLDFLLFMAFFPKLLSGPITRATNFCRSSKRRRHRRGRLEPRGDADPLRPVEEGRAGDADRYAPRFRGVRHAGELHRARAVGRHAGLRAAALLGLQRLHRHGAGAGAAAGLSAAGELQPSLHRRRTSATSGAAGTSRSPTGCATTSSSRWAG